MMIWWKKKVAYGGGGGAPDSFMMDLAKSATTAMYFSSGVSGAFFPSGVSMAVSPRSFQIVIPSIPFEVYDAEEERADGKFRWGEKAGEEKELDLSRDVTL